LFFPRKPANTSRAVHFALGHSIQMQLFICIFLQLLSSDRKCASKNMCSLAINLVRKICAVRDIFCFPTTQECNVSSLYVTAWFCECAGASARILYSWIVWIVEVFIFFEKHTHTHTHTNTQYILLVLNFLHLLVLSLQNLLKLLVYLWHSFHHNQNGFSGYLKTCTTKVLEHKNASCLRQPDFVLGELIAVYGKLNFIL